MNVINKSLLPTPQPHGHMYMVHLMATGQSGDEIDLIEFIGDESDDPGQPQHQEVLPTKVNDLKPDASTVDSLCVFKFLDKLY